MCFVLVKFGPANMPVSQANHSNTFEFAPVTFPSLIKTIPVVWEGCQWPLKHNAKKGLARLEPTP
jgi:hypothetical protein